MNFSKLLLQWYDTYSRDLPWRGIKDPYRIWLSEIIMQQTRVSQGLPYYERFVETFPTVHDLAAASEEQVLKLWQGLGYYSRARNLHTAAKQVLEMGGNFPDSYTELLKLKGVGDYTAAAIASFAFDEVVPVVDGNVYRVLSRIYGINTPINTPLGAKEFKALAVSLIDKKNPATYNQAIMEYGALQCTPKNPDCMTCVFESHCIAKNTGQIAVLPVKIKSKPVLHLYYHYLVIQTPSNRTVILQRSDSGIWAKLYEFPFIEQETLSLTQLKEHSMVQELLGKVRFRESVINTTPIIHKLSHRHVHASFYLLQTKNELDNSIQTIEIKEAFKLPVHILMQRVMKMLWNDYI